MSEAAEEGPRTHGLLGTDLAPEGLLWVCGACGKRSRSRYGFDAGKRRTALDSGWDESCMMNAVLCRVVEGKAKAVEEDFEVAPETLRAT